MGKLFPTLLAHVLANRSWQPFAETFVAAGHVSRRAAGPGHAHWQWPVCWIRRHLPPAARLRLLCGMATERPVLAPWSQSINTQWQVAAHHWGSEYTHLAARVGHVISVWPTHRRIGHPVRPGSGHFPVRHRH